MASLHLQLVQYKAGSYNVHSSRVAMFIATIRSRELATITPLAGVAVPTTSGRSQHERGGFPGLQMSVAR